MPVCSSHVKPMPRFSAVHEATFGSLVSPCERINRQWLHSPRPEYALTASPLPLCCDAFLFSASRGVCEWVWRRHTDGRARHEQRRGCAALCRVCSFTPMLARLLAAG